MNNHMNASVSALEALLNETGEALDIGIDALMVKQGPLVVHFYYTLRSIANMKPGSAENLLARKSIESERLLRLLGDSGPIHTGDTK